MPTGDVGISSSGQQRKQSGGCRDGPQGRETAYSLERAQLRTYRKELMTRMYKKLKQLNTQKTNSSKISKWKNKLNIQFCETKKHKEPINI